MSSLRRRLPAMEASSDVKTPDHVLSISKADSKYARKRALDRGRIRTMLSSLAVAVVFVVFKNFSPTSLPPESYALCSPEGRIYTVDPLRNVTECILIHGKFILEAGSLGLFSPALSESF